MSSGTVALLRVWCCSNIIQVCQRTRAASGFAQWKALGVQTDGDLVVDGSFASFSRLQVQSGLHSNSFFRYLQIKDYVRKYIPTLEKTEPAKFDKIFKMGGREKRLLCVICSSASVQGVKTLGTGAGQ